MNLNQLNDRELLSQTKQLVQTEREVLTKVLHHILEVDRRKLFSDLGYQSLFEYAVKELKYSEGQAGRRVQAMRLIREIPELEHKIESGDLSLSNISQAQSYFREAKKAAPQMKISSAEKLKVLESLENKSVRDGQKILISLQPQAALPRERERILSDSHTEHTFVEDEKLKSQLEEVRSLLGPKGFDLNLAELVGEMAVISIRELKIRKFGRKRSSLASQDAASQKTGAMDHLSKDHRSQEVGQPELNLQISDLDDQVYPSADSENLKMVIPQTSGLTDRVCPSTAYKAADKKIGASITSELASGIWAKTSSKTKTKTVIVTPDNNLTQLLVSTPEARRDKDPRYISRAIRHEVWNRDQEICRICGSKRYLNFDHIKPVALGGLSTVDNLRLLCSQCNQRQAIKIFGADKIQSEQLKSEPLT